MVKVVVFDAFNTLVKRDKQYVTEPYKLVMERATKEIFNPMGTNFSVRQYAEAIGSVYTREEMLKIEHDLEIELEHITPFEDSHYILKAVKKGGYKIAIGSNLAPAYGPKLVEIFGKEVDEYFFSYEMGYSKPNPIFYISIMDFFEDVYGISDPSEYFMVGDSYKNDYLAPKELGWKALHLSRSGNYPDSIKNLNSIFIQLPRNVS